MGRASRLKRERRIAEAEARRHAASSVSGSAPAVKSNGVEDSRTSAEPLGTVIPTSVCVYCTRRPGPTRDHIPPKGLGGSGHRITVPSCAECNNGQSKEDEYFRAKVAPHVAAQHPAARDAWNTTFRGMQRPEAAGFKRAFFESLRYAEIVDHAGQRRRVLAYETKAVYVVRVFRTIWACE